MRRLARQDIDPWYQQMITGQPWRSGKPLAQRSARTHVSRLRSALAMAVDEGLVSLNPARVPPKAANKAAPIQASDIFSVEQVQAIIADLAKTAPQVALYVRIAPASGLRTGEIAGLRCEDVEFLRREVRVLRQYGRAGYALLKTAQSYRQVQVADDLLVHLSEACTEAPSSPVVRSPAGRPVAPQWASELLKRTCERLGVSGVTMHTFRHF